MKALLRTFLFAASAAVGSAQFTLADIGNSFRGDATNLAAASNGGIAIGQDELDLGTHYIANINDGTYGNSSSWIGATDGLTWVGVIFSAPTAVGSFAFGRDNSGAFFDRANGVYAIQYTTDSVTVGTAPSATWLTIGSLDYGSSPPPSPSFRHLYDLNSPLTGVTAFRILTTGSIAPTGQAIDELEVYATSAIPEPSTYALVAGLLGLALAGWLRRHSRTAA